MLALLLLACTASQPAKTADTAPETDADTDTDVDADTDTDADVDTGEPEDTDGDGFASGDGDCDDADASVYPGADDPVGDGIDADCDGEDGARPADAPPEGAVVCSADALSDALSAAGAGDTVVLCDGEWENLSVSLSAEGTAAAPVTLRAETDGGARLTGDSHLSISGRFVTVRGLLFDASASTEDELIEFRVGSAHCYDCRLTNSAIVGARSADGGAMKWVSLFGARNRVDHSTFSGKSELGALLVVWRRDEDPLDQHVIDHNAFLDRDPEDENGAETIRIGTSGYATTDSETVVAYNYFDDASGEIEIISSKAGGNRFWANTFTASVGQLTLRHGDNAHVEGNWFLADGASSAGGVRVIGAGHVIVNNYVEGVRTSSSVRGGVVVMTAQSDPVASGYQPVVDVTIAHNTFVDCEQSLVLGTGGYPVPPSGVTLANNLFVDAVGPVIREEEAMVSVSSVGNAWQGDGGLGETALGGFSELSLAPSVGGVRWRPDASSAAVDAGDGSLGLAGDIDGQPRDAAPDIGADEVSAAPGAVHSGPLTLGDVGPTSWRPETD